MNDCLLLAEKYSTYGGIDYIDFLFSGYTGRNMKPLITIDFVGLDVHKAIVDNIYGNYENSLEKEMTIPKFFNKLIDNGSLGVKNNRGLYHDKDSVYDIEKDEYRKIKKYKNNVVCKINNSIADGKYEEAYRTLFKTKRKDMELVKKMLVTYVVYSIIVASESSSIDACDDAMAKGFGWCPPLALKELISKVSVFDKLIDKYIPNDIIKRYDLHTLMNKLPKSRYNYQKYIRAS